MSKLTFLFLVGETLLTFPCLAVSAFYLNKPTSQHKSICIYFYYYYYIAKKKKENYLCICNEEKLLVS